MRCDIFRNELNFITEDDVLHMAEYLLNNASDSLYYAPSSSSGKYHPLADLGYAGNVRHSKAVCRFINYIVQLEYLDFTEREKNLLIVASLYHDGEKQGRNGSNYTLFNHPLLARDEVLKYPIPEGSNITEEDKQFVADCIASHMGQWNTSNRTKTVLPKPATKAQFALHLADYLASKRDITLDFEGDEGAYPPLPDINEYRLNFGKMKGKTLIEISEECPDYLAWMINESKEKGFTEPVQSLLNYFVGKED